MTTSEKYWWIVGHVHFINCDFEPVTIDVEPHDVCPLTNRIENYPPLNTKPRYWVELYTPSYDEDKKEWHKCHDYKCDTGGDSYDEAIENLYQLVLEKYGNYTEEEYDLKYEEVHNIHKSGNNYYSNFFKTPHEVTNKWNTDVMQEFDILKFQEDLENEKKYMNALIEFKKTCTMEQLQEVNSKIQMCEHEIWIKEECLRMGIDIDL